jgi:hypothetical protein
MDRHVATGDRLTHHFLIDPAWVILNSPGAWLGYSILSMTAGVSTASKPDQKVEDALPT